MKKDQIPLLGEILSSDLTYNFFGFSYRTFLSGLGSLNPSQVWEQIQYDPWMAMAVFEDMEEKDDAVSSSLDTRKDAVLAKPRRVIPASDKRQDKKIAEFVKETLETYYNPLITEAGLDDQSKYTGFEGFLWELLDSVGRGVTIGEIIWAERQDRIYIEDVKFHPQHLFSFNENSITSASLTLFGRQTGPLHLRYTFGVPGVGADGLLPPMKFIVGTYRPRNSNRWGTPLLRKVFWVSWFKRAGLKQMLRYVEKGSGSVVSRYPDGAGIAEQQKALAAAMAINEESATALPNKFMVEVLEHVRASLGDVHKGLIDDICNNAILRVIQGQTLTSRGSEGGGSRALGEVHQGVRGEKTEGDSKFCMQVVNRQMVAPIVFYNFGPNAKLPTWVIDYDPPDDLEASSTVHERVVKKIGLPVGTKFFYDFYQLPEPSDGEETLGPSPEGDPDEEETRSAEFTEKKTSPNDDSKSRSHSKIARFSKLRPSTMKY